MNKNLIVGVSIGVVIGLAVGVFVGLFILPSLVGDTNLDTSDYTRITVYSGNNKGHQFGDYSYTFFYNWELTDNVPHDEIVVETSNIFRIIPSNIGIKQTILDLDIIVDEVYDDYVVLRARLAT